MPSSDTFCILYPSSMKQGSHFIFPLLIVVTGIVIFITTKRVLPPNIVPRLNVSLPSPTPFPFEEATIDGLRKRSYTGTLGEKTMYEKRSAYTSYLTSYTSDTYKINALLTEPTGPMPQGGWPAIVFIHGYIPPKQYETTSRYVAYVDYLASQGFAVLKIDLRGHGQSEGQAGGAYYSSDYVVDTLNAYAALQGYQNINPDRIGLWGHSMAGNVVMRSAAVKPTIPAVVIWAGVGYTYEDIQKYRISDASYQRPPSMPTIQGRRRNPIVEIYGEPNLAVPFWQKFAPASYLHELQGAIQIHHAIDDDVVNIEYSRDLNALLEKTSVPHEFFEYQSGGHNIEGYSFAQAMERTSEFYKKNLSR